MKTNNTKLLEVGDLVECPFCNKGIGRVEEVRDRNQFGLVYWPNGSGGWHQFDEVNIVYGS